MPKATIDKLAPAFSLLDFKGDSLNLSDLREQKNVLLIFNRGFV